MSKSRILWRQMIDRRFWEGQRKQDGIGAQGEWVYMCGHRKTHLITIWREAVSSAGREGRAKSQDLEEREEGLKQPSQSGKSEVNRQGEGPERSWCCDDKNTQTRKPEENIKGSKCLSLHVRVKNKKCFKVTRSITLLAELQFLAIKFKKYHN